jgi:hypothetical protein
MDTRTRGMNRQRPRPWEHEHDCIDVRAELDAP